MHPLSGVIEKRLERGAVLVSNNMVMHQDIPYNLLNGQKNVFIHSCAVKLGYVLFICIYLFR